MPANPVAKPNTPAVSKAHARAIQSLAWPDVWAEDLSLEVDAHGFSMVGREYQRAILRDESKTIDVPKGAQLGLTTVFLLKSIHAIVIRNRSVLYLLPLKAGSIPFVQSRIDPIMDSNPELKSHFKRVDNRGQKVTTKGVKWNIRGTNIASELREVPADVLVLDERDVANEENLGDAFARLDGSDYARVYSLSTPTVDGHGVYSDSGFPATDKQRWWVPCTHCGSKQIISFDDNVLPHLADTIEECVDVCRCIHCHKSWTDNDRANMNAGGVWVPESPQVERRGYHISQLNSPTKTLADPLLGILANWYLGQTDSAKLKSFYTLALGLPYASPGDKFTVELLDKARGDFSLGGMPDGPVFIGIDQGHDVLFVSMWTRTRQKRLRLWQLRMITGTTDRSKWKVLEEEVLQSIGQWLAVCDAHPDKEDCEALSKKYPGQFWMGFEKDRPDQEATAKFAEVRWGEPAKVMIDRTMAFDTYIKLFIDGNVLLPREARDLGEHMPRKAYNSFYHHHLQMTRVQQADASDRLVARWVNGRVTADKKSAGQGNRPDHFHHSAMFGLVASMKEVPLQVTEDVGELFVRSGGLIGIGA
jgi:hypothetical protein